MGGAYEGLNEGGKQLLYCRFGQMLASGLNLQMVSNKSNVIILIMIINGPIKITKGHSP
jgi:hypothetical protein